MRIKGDMNLRHIARLTLSTFNKVDAVITFTFILILMSFMREVYSKDL